MPADQHMTCPHAPWYQKEGDEGAEEKEEEVMEEERSVSWIDL